MPGNYRSGCSQSSIGWNTGPLMKEVEKVSQELKGSATLYEEQQFELNPQSSVFSCICSRGWPSWPSMGGKALGLAKIICPSTGECKGQEAGVGELGSRVRGGYRGLWDSILNVNLENI